jgi:hypothetical protein
VSTKRMRVNLPMLVDKPFPGGFTRGRFMLVWSAWAIPS